MESNPGQTLSPEAAVFVPRQNPNCMGTPLQLQQIPTYMTNCYPFVQGEMDRIQAGLNHGTRQIRPSGHLNNKAVRLMSGNRFPRPQTSNPPVQNFSGDTNHWKGVISPGPPLVNNLFPGTVINAANDMESPVVQGHFPKFPNSSRRQFKSSAKKGDERQNEDLSQNLISRMPASNLHEENHSSNSYRGNRRGGRGRRKEWQKEIQEKPDGHRNNIAMGNNSTSHISKKTDLVPTIPFAGGHTVIVKETSVQTDFPDHYANLTLLSHPSPLYSSSPQDSVLGKRPSESDADSDSGYNSPLHRKIALGGSHQPSVGTDSMMHLNHSVLSYPSNISCIQSEHVPTSSTTAGEFKLSYAFITQKKPVPKTYNTLPVTGDKDSHENHLSTDLTKTDQGGRRSRRSRSKKEESVGQSHVTFTGQSDVSQEDVKENIEETEGKKKRKRRRKRKRKKKEGEEEETGIMGSACTKQEVDLHFEDEEEFPDLTSSGIRNKQENTSVPAVSYSAKLKSTSVPQPKPEYSVDDIAKQMDENRNEENIENEQKGSRRRRKRQQMLQKAAEEELAEISFEQQMLRELNLKPKQKGIGKDTQTPGILKVNPQPSGKKSKQAVSLDLSAMIDALEKKKLDTSQKKVEQVVVKKKIHAKTEDGRRAGMGHNMLDSSAPVKRGKERENPKPKKPSSLKKVILKEREEKKKLKLLDDSETNNSIPLGVGIVCGNESDLSQDAMSTKSMNEYSYMGTPASNDLSPISQTSPISMSPLSPGVSPQSSEVNSPIAGTIGKEVRMKIHSRRFREYCNQVLNKDIDNCCTELLKDLVRFQDRIYHKDPSKAKSKRRIVLGLREVTKHLKLKKIKCVIISPNLEKIQSKGGLDDALNNILNLCNEQNTPFVFALGRRALGRACAKLVPVSVVGIFNYEGSNENFQQLMELTELARQSYKEMVSVIEKEIRDYPTLGAAAAVPHIYAHMGHSRTPSGASVLSFTSSILSEPISENYPHSEPETDSKGYEIVKDAEVEKSPEKMPFGKLKGPSIQMLKNQMIYSSVNLDVDEGNEADTEEYVQRKFSEGHGSVTEECIGYPDSDQSSDHGSDTVKALPHIDSIHSSMQELNTEILSQISGRTYDNCDAISTHSSRTLGDGSSTILADTGDRSKHDTPKSAGSPSNTLQRGKVIDAERIQNWVHQTQSRLENLQQSQENSGHESDSDTDSEDGENLEDLDGNSDQTKTENSQGHNSDGQINYEVTVKNSEPLNCPVDFRNNNGHGTVIKQENSQAHLPSIAEGSELSETEVSIKEAESSSITLTVFDS